MGKDLYYILFLLWLCYLIVSSILLFTRGFLLTRVVQNNNATCVPLDEIDCANADNSEQSHCPANDKISNLLSNYKTTSDTCLPPRAKVVLLIVDALRYDFITFSDTNKNPLPFQNKIPVIDELLKKYPKHTRRYKFIADPPTTTMQRIKGFTTGSLPTFIDAGSNFATSEISEDNIIDQVLRNNYKAVFMGDDTWNGLYPNRFVRNYPYPSFNVWDLDTVDNGVQSHLYNELNNTDWNVLIGHFLGVDHCGHRYGPNHPEMERKLGEMNSVIRNVVDQIDDMTMLFVIGDHGMTSTGDHGGESEDEVTAGLFVYSKQPLFDTDERKESVKQVDIVPTLATILGVPIPFQNLGILIIDCLPVSSKFFNVEEWRLVLYSLWVNVNQVLNYIKEYSENTKTFNEEAITDFNQKFSVLRSRLISVHNEEQFLEVSKSFMEFILDLRTMCEEVWIQFDSLSMARGLLLLFLSTFFTFIIADGIPYAKLSEIFRSSFILFSYAILLLAAATGYTLYILEFVENLQSIVFFSTGIASQVILVILIIQNWEIISLNWYDKSRKEKLLNLICRIILVFNVCGLFSNSYIIEESFVLLFLLITVILIGTVGVMSTNTTDTKRKVSFGTILKWPKLNLLLLATLIAVLVRGSMYFWRCREEQQWCFANPHEVSNITAKMETSKLQWGISVIFLVVFVFITKEWLKNCGNLNGYSITVLLVKFAPTVIVVCIAGFWVLKRVPSSKKQLNPLKSVDGLAWTIYTLSLSGIIVTVLKPLCTYILPGSENSEGRTIPSLFNRIKNTISEKQRPSEEIPVICGLGTVYSSVFVILGVYVTLLLALLLSDAVAPAATIMFMTAAFILIITSVLRIEKAESLEQLFEIPNMSILVWIILAQYFFYGSGHQPTFPNISWEAAFIGTSGIFTNNIIPGTLIIMNTFSSYILMGLLLPLILITPFTIFVMLPSLVGKKTNDFQLVAARGEVVLFEQNHITLTSMFVLSCKYIIGHGIRVFASMLAATIHCRHLMVWKIFAPKFIFESIGMFVTLVSVIIGFLILIRINRKVWKLIVSLNKLN